MGSFRGDGGVRGMAVNMAEKKFGGLKGRVLMNVDEFCYERKIEQPTLSGWTGISPAEGHAPGGC